MAVAMVVYREATLVEALKNRGTKSDKTITKGKAETPPKPSTRSEVNFSSIFDLESMGCEECASTTGPAAYFVDLLQSLKKVIDGSKNLEELLFKRRPDLKSLKLSCANIKVLIPYIDLVNEILEQVLLDRTSNPKLPLNIPSFNMDEDDAVNGHLSNPAHTNYYVYRSIVKGMVYPMTNFPYNQAIHSIRVYLKVLGTSRRELLRRLQSPYRVKNAWLRVNKTITQDEAKTTLNRALGAETLGMQPEDYAILTQKNYRQAWVYWGYETEEQMLGTSGLTDIKKGLLPRSGLEFRDLLVILQTKTFQGKLVIESGDLNSGKPAVDKDMPQFTGKLQEMRLHKLQKEGKTAALDTPCCQQLHTFLRLRMKLGWPIEELDAILDSLVNGQIEYLDPNVLDAIAAIKELVELTGYSPSELQPLWGDINTHGGNSLYARRFLNDSIDANARHVFEMLRHGTMSLPIYPNGKRLDYTISGHARSVSLALGVSESDILSNVGPNMVVPDVLSLNNISILYRRFLLCKILNIHVAQYEDVMTLFVTPMTVFDTPQDTLRMVREAAAPSWDPDPLTLEQILAIVKPTTGADERKWQSDKSLVKFTSLIRSTLEKAGLIRKDHSIPPSAMGPSSHGQREMGIYDTQILEEGMRRPSYDDLEALKERLEPSLGAGEASSMITHLFSAPADKRSELISEMTSKAQMGDTHKLLIQCVLKCLKSRFPEASVDLIHFVLEELAPKEAWDFAEDTLLWMNPFKGYFLPAIDGVYAFRTISCDPRILWIDGYKAELEPRSWLPVSLTGGNWCKIEYSGIISELSFELGGTSSNFRFCLDSLLAEQNVQTTHAVINTMVSLLGPTRRLALSVTELSFWKKQGTFNLLNLGLPDLRLMEKYHFLREVFRRNGTKVPLLDLYQWLHRPPKDRTGNLTSVLSRVSGWPLDVCTDFLDAKYSKSVAEPERIAIFKDIDTLFEMQQAIAFIQKLNLPKKMIEPLFAMATPAPLDDNTASEFSDAAQLRSAMQMRYARPASDGSPTVFSTANDEIRNGQRQALVHTLLQQKYAREYQLWDADKLFGHFLIDVQMGPVLQTSRIKQAIATVQLFIQQCLLGKESGISKPCLVQLQKTADEECLFHYRLWEANRKAFLYPENWLDPVLRDDKSEQFQALESALMQTKLDSESVTTLVRDYVHNTNDIAHLQLEAFLWERTAGQADDYTVHLFSRSRHSPFTFYYRRMRKHKSGLHHWCPWTMMDIDIPVIVAQADGKTLEEPGSYLLPAIYNGRLHVFFPEFSASQAKSQGKPKPPPNPPKVGDMTLDELKKNTSQTTTQPHWEIRMGFTQLRDGKWSRKVVSSSKLLLPPTQGKNQAPLDVRDLRFPIKKEYNGLTIRAELHGEPRDQGGFQFNGQGQLTVGGAMPAQHMSFPKTQFGKFREGSTDYLVSFYDCAANNNKPTAISIADVPPASLQASKAAKWTLKRSWVYVADWKRLGQAVRDIQTEYNGQYDEHSPGKGMGKVINGLADLIDNIDRYIHPSLKDQALKDLKDEKGAAEDFRKKYPEPMEILQLPSLENSASPILMGTMAATTGLKPVYQCIRDKFNDPKYDNVFGKQRIKPKGPNDSNEKVIDIFCETATPPAIYMWELAVHIPCLLMERLIATQQFQLALMVARLLFDPTTPGDSISRCWSFPPFTKDEVRKPTGDGSTGSQFAMHEWLEGKSNVHAAARGKPVAYMKRIVMKYIEAVVALGDGYFRENSLESMPLAIQRYVEASHVYGAPAVEIPRLGKRAVKSYQEITAVESKVYMALDFPFWSKKPEPTATNTIEALGFVFTGYFCVAGNPFFKSLRDLIDDRLYKIRNGLDINGNKLRLPLFEPPLDPGAVVRANAGAGGITVAGLLAGLKSPMPNYRFRYLLQRAFEIVDQLKVFGQRFLSIREKKDAEALSLLRSQHQNSLLVLVQAIKQQQKDEIDGSIATLTRAREQQEHRLTFYLSLTGDAPTIPKQGEAWTPVEQAFYKPSTGDLRCSSYDSTQMHLMSQAQDKMLDARVLQFISAGLILIPDFAVNAQPWGMGMSFNYGGSQLGQSTAAGAGAAETLAQYLSSQGEMAGRQSALERQLQERRMEINMAGDELMRIDGEIAELIARKKTWDAEISAQEQQIQSAAAEETFLRSKYTNEQLYVMLDNSIGSLYHTTYLLACEMAQTAKRALEFEHSRRFPNSGSRVTELTPGLVGYWDDSRHGQLAGEALYLDLKRLEMMHMENQAYDYEVTKAVSLRQLDSFALFQLRATGRATFSMPEVLFDMDYPGHYCRRIVSVVVSIPCILGAYTSLNCTLRLTKHKYRITPPRSADDCAKEDSLVSDMVPIQAIAVSSGIQDTGGYHLSFAGSDKYGPFEGAGAITTWQIELPAKFRQFDYNTISDVVLHLRYTALFDGGASEVATKNVISHLKDSKDDRKSPPLVVIDFKNDYSGEWQNRTTRMTLAGLRRHLPYWTLGSAVSADTIYLFAHPPSVTKQITIGSGSNPLTLSNTDKIGNYVKLWTNHLQEHPIAINEGEDWTLNLNVLITMLRG